MTEETKTNINSDLNNLLNQGLIDTKTTKSPTIFLFDVDGTLTMPRQVLLF
jgi:hypothetical protein